MYFRSNIPRVTRAFYGISVISAHQRNSFFFFSTLSNEEYINKAKKFTRSKDSITNLALTFMNIDNESEKKVMLAKKEAETKSSQKESYFKSLLSAITQR